jgi:hypothetical protein
VSGQTLDPISRCAAAAAAALPALVYTIRLHHCCLLMLAGGDSPQERQAVGLNKLSGLMLAAAVSTAMFNVRQLMHPATRLKRWRWGSRLNTQCNPSSSSTGCMRYALERRCWYVGARVARCSGLPCAQPPLLLLLLLSLSALIVTTTPSCVFEV